MPKEEGAPLGEEGTPLGEERATKCKDTYPTTHLGDTCEQWEEEEGATTQEVGNPLKKCATSPQEVRTSSQWKHLTLVCLLKYQPITHYMHHIAATWCFEALFTQNMLKHVSQILEFAEFI
jgi:hypothetical protein